MPGDLKTFIDRVFIINPSLKSAYGGAPGITGSGVNSFGASGTEILRSLKLAVSQLAKALQKNASAQVIEPLAQDIEGYILTLQVLNEISEPFAKELIDKLHSLTVR